MAKAKKKRKIHLSGTPASYTTCWRYNNNVYYIDASVLLENNQWQIFHILTSEVIDDVIYRFLRWIYCIIKRKLHGGLKIWILSSRGENNILLIVLICKILFSPLEDKIHIFAPPCNYPLYMYILLTKLYRKLRKMFLSPKRNLRWY